ncbi:Selenocysteine insertion sequence-binding protein 2 [Seminavis robusta]|uniref:Selenocysteine insertion sequence-binding protein 2 n=1 Tax=Seminavis robusta TaxID=568900 RepID=A0A9N8E9V7_9STRA|nr:Selenocysteine insertion sequence-binding protein 2 [Seminavis robusta]|eukprot:Sro785_g202170.1 Selenocysteine insertion sequence-binding protein 2 (983) ;mRNA; f:35725-38673
MSGEDWHQVTQQNRRQVVGGDRTKQPQAWPRQQHVPHSHKDSRPGPQNGSHQQPPNHSGNKQSWRHNNDTDQRRNQPIQHQQPQQHRRQQPHPPKARNAPLPPQNAWNNTGTGTGTGRAPQKQDPRFHSEAAAPPVPAPANASASAMPKAQGTWATMASAKRSGGPNNNQNHNTRGTNKGPTSAKTTPPSIVSPDTNQQKGNKNQKRAPHQKDQKNNKKNNNATANQRQIHGKKPKLASMSMGDLVPKITTILPKDKNNKPNNSNNHNSQRPATQKSFSLQESQDFPALATTSNNWPSLGQQASRPVRAATAKKAAQESSQNNNNTNTPKKRKNASSQQVTDTKTGKAKKKDSSPLGNGANNNMLAGRPDANHLQAQFLLPPGKMLLDPKLDAAHGGDAQQLMFMMKNQGQMMKGRQRIKPRKKRFTALKRKILLERLKVWKESQGGAASVESNVEEDGESLTVCVEGFVTREELEDEDEYEEVLANFQDMVEKVGEFKQIFIPRAEHDAHEAAEDSQPVFVRFSTSTLARAARDCWDGLVIGGEPLRATVVALIVGGIGEDTKEEEVWQDACLQSTKGQYLQPEDGFVAETNTILATSTKAELLLQNILTEDDLEEAECLEESLGDVRSLLNKYGTVSNLDTEGTSILATFDDMNEATLHETASELNGMCLGGQIVTVKVLEREAIETSCVVLRNILTEDDIEDDECLEESLDDVRELACKYGTVINIDAAKTDSPSTSTVKVTYSTASEAEAAATEFSGMVIGGETVTASFEDAKGSVALTNSTNGDTQSGETGVGTNEEQAESGQPKPMFSGDKRIPERFAECKRAPKVPNKGTPRSYAVLIDDDTVKPLLVEMLNELMRLQMRALNDKNAKARRRVVVGLRECHRCLRANKAKMIIMANNLDDYGAIDDKLQEILDLAAEKEIPVLFELSKRVLGKAVGKKIKVSVVAIQGTDGAHQQFVKLSKLAHKTPKTGGQGGS